MLEIGKRRRETMSSGNYDFYGFYPSYSLNNNVNGDPNFDGFSSFNVYNSLPFFDSALPQLHHHTSPSSLQHYSSGVENERETRNEGRFGLKLTKTASFISSLNELTKKVDSKSALKSDNNVNFCSPEKLKAANFPAISLQIGSWKIVSRYEGDLVTKCYFKKKKLVWEILDGNMKKKVEFQWSDISAIRAIFPENSPAVLDIMLEKSPLFFQEVNPQPRKHTNWDQTHDFTHGQASLIRRHTVVFSEGVLEKQYEKLLQADPRLHKLSQQPFPDHSSPLFREIRFDNHNPPMPVHDQSFPDFAATQHSPPKSLGHFEIRPIVSDLDHNLALGHFLERNSHIPMGESDIGDGYSVQDYSSFASADSIPQLGFDQFGGGWNYESVDEIRQDFDGHYFIGDAPWL